MDWGYVFSLFGYGEFWRASLTVVELSLLAWTISTVLGMLVALGRMSHFRPLAVVLNIYVWFFRSLPLLVLLIFVYNAPSVWPGLKAILGNPFISGLVALVLSETAYISEIHRGGIQAVAAGQAEAARALGLPWWRVQFGIVIPQAFRVSLPTLGNELVTIVKLTSLVSSISLTELLLAGQRLYTQNFKVLETLLVVAIFYVMLVTIFELGLRLLERYLDVSKRRQKDSQVEVLTPIPRAPEPREKRPHSGEVVLTARGVTKTFGSTQVLHGIDLDVHRGEVIVIIGPSGSGKTSFIRTLNGLELIDGGNVLFEGVPLGYRKHGDTYVRPVDRVIARQRQDVGMVFQQFNLFPHKTVLQNVTFAPSALGRGNGSEGRATGMELLRKVGLVEHAGKYPHQLSGGQQQRVAIARALAMSPEIVLFDEPTSALDPELVDEVLAVMTELANEGLTMVVVTHEMRFARQVADWVVFLDHGNIGEQGPADEFFTHPRTERAQEFLARVS